MKLDVLPTVEDLLEGYRWIRLDLQKHPDKEPTKLETRSVRVQKVKDFETQYDYYAKLIRYPVCKRNEN